MDTDKLKALALAATIYPGYSVDRDGNVWSESNWRGYGRRMLTQFPNSHGYPSVKVKFEGRMKKALVHVMVCRAFHGPKPSDAHQVRHLNGIRSNCRADNLAWGTPKENAEDRERHGTGKAAENGRTSAWKLVGRGRPTCIRGHDKRGKPNCSQCRRERRHAQRALAATEGVK
ncbi:HNH endonuclease signature motif containing protein [Massilia sp. CT11-137]|uniref:HNH endonuclease signature motif containing protein n=1 Tax=Massilia sp. CT11-137 TaxID=3393901 RepID=UPI0039B0DB1F